MKSQVKRNRKRLSFWLITSGLVLGIISVLLDLYFRPIIKSMASIEAKTIASECINESVMEQLQRGEINYNSLVTLSTSSDGYIRAIETNILEMNKLRASIVENILKKMRQLDKEDLSIPLGTLLGVQLFAGRGPEIGFRIVPKGMVTAEFSSKFESAGINQTSHQIYIHVNADISAIIPGYTVDVNISSDIMVAQTIIVGEIPESFADIQLGAA